MPLYTAFLSSIILHALIILGPAWFATRPAILAQPRIEARLLVPEEALATEDNLSSAAATPDSVEPPLPKPQSLQGAALHRAEAALTPHLFYPPEAVARGIEGEVILLLTLTDHGQLASVDIARSSGHALLDQAALDAARRIGRLPGTKHQLLFPVSFRLQ
ncbi:MAG: energy transducer TonB [Rhodocyclales bacterium]|nr:energy transducer TonB [Rhodocyclales bacterium]